MSLSETQKRQIITLFARAKSDNDFSLGLKRMNLLDPAYEEEIADLLYAIATNKPVPKSNG